MHRNTLGVHELAPVAIGHPLSTLTEAKMERRAERATVQGVRIWRGRSL